MELRCQARVKVLQDSAACPSRPNKYFMLRSSFSGNGPIGAAEQLRHNSGGQAIGEFWVVPLI
jgi:hypothetical protein